jgi:hypothetical protein
VVLIIALPSHVMEKLLLGVMEQAGFWVMETTLVTLNQNWLVEDWKPKELPMANAEVIIME